MAIKIIKKIPSQEEIEQAAPLSAVGYTAILKDRQEICDILSGKDDRLLLIIGPCSAWPFDAVIEYATRLISLKKELNLEKEFKVIMRVYTQKPRTTTGWNGPINQPDPLGQPDIAGGIKYTRKLMVQLIEMGLPIANEAVFTHDSMKFFPDLLSWMAIGARSSEDQEHRIYASAVDCPVGMKNPTSGSIKIGVNSIIAAQTSQVAVFHGHQIESSGNKYAHLVLRGGESGPNYATKFVLEAGDLMKKNNILNPAIIIDASHDNSKVDGKKNPEQQIKVVQESIAELKSNLAVKNLVKGFMIESFIKSGSQTIDPRYPESIDRGGLSVTDPCINWETTAELLSAIFKKI
ncbi:MAG: 3-deoxy-7-phosphoheptulonate synthase [Candidatus Magasanikbacteria bacterium]|nr:3-deoxy-7-phosphoheptulonate synthase [Candidatus Magasanikbacteria bacterium]